jgi:hypothetical protein
MGQVTDLQDWRRCHPAGAARATELSRAWRAPQAFWAQPLLLSSLTVWRGAAVMWAGTVLTPSGEMGFPQEQRRAPALVPAANSPVGGRP